MYRILFQKANDHGVQEVARCVHPTLLLDLYRKQGKDMERVKEILKGPRWEARFVSTRNSNLD